VNEKPALGIIAVAGFIITLGEVPSVFASTAESFLTLERADVSVDENEDDLIARLMVEGVGIPSDGTEGQFGYGILADDGDVILISHTHPGILDSEDQRFSDDPIWHNHLVKLGFVEQCGDDQGIVDITWQSPGEVRINDNVARIGGAPTNEFEGWDSINGESLSMTLGRDVSDVVSFKINPVFGDDGLDAICLTDVRSVEEDVNMD
jgi:hypothetical protein